jgi:hypothetical protein
LPMCGALPVVFLFFSFACCAFTWSLAVPKKPFLCRFQLPMRGVLSVAFLVFRVFLFSFLFVVGHVFRGLFPFMACRHS